MTIADQYNFMRVGLKFDCSASFAPLVTSFEVSLAVCVTICSETQISPIKHKTHHSAREAIKKQILRDAIFDVVKHQSHNQVIGYQFPALQRKRKKRRYQKKSNLNTEKRHLGPKAFGVGT